MHEGSPSLACENVLPSHLDHSHVSTFRSQPSFSPEHSFDVPNGISELCDSKVNFGHENNMFNMLGENVEAFESLGYFSGYDTALDPYYIKLGGKPRKILWNTFFTFCFDFSMAFTLMKRALTFCALILHMLSDCQACKPFAERFDKLPRALTASTLNNRVLKN